MRTTLTNEYRPDIDGLRAIAVLAVVLNHLSSRLVPGGYVGVDIFFVISGYLITGIIAREIGAGQFTFARFYERRARRIFPALFAMLAVTIVAGYLLLLPSDYAATFRGALGTLLFSSNILFWREMDAGYFAATDAKLNPLLHTWSLSVEEQFYVLFPVLLLVCYRHFRKHITWILVGFTVLSFAGAVLLVHSKAVAVFFLSPFRAWELFAGAILALGEVPKVRSRMIRETLAAGGLLAITVALYFYDERTVFPGLTALLPVLGTVAIIYAGSSGQTFVGRLLQWRPVVYIGLTSYSLYLWHWPVIVFAQYANALNPLTQYLPAILAASLLLGCLSYHFVEQPFRRGARVRTKSLVKASAAFAAVLIVVCIVGLSERGFAGRYGSAVIALDSAREPQIPYLQCVERSPQQWCTIGNSKSAPNILLWGDSHLLAWAPALNESLATQDRQAFLATLSACPPLLNIEVTVNPACSTNNLAIKAYLQAHTEIKTVVLSANWGWYFLAESPVTGYNGGDLLGTGTSIAQRALASTIEWLQANGRQVILIGPVPTYGKSVPLSLAMEAAGGHHKKEYSLASEQRTKYAPFFDVVETIARRDTFVFLDPIQWLCAKDCLVMNNNLPIYRDSNHLSVAGAMGMEPHLTYGLSSAFARTAEALPKDDQTQTRR